MLTIGAVADEAGDVAAHVPGPERGGHGRVGAEVDRQRQRRSIAAVDAECCQVGVNGAIGAGPVEADIRP